MNDGLIRVAAATPKVKVGDPEWNRERKEEIIKDCEEAGGNLLVFPGLCLTA